MVLRIINACVFSGLSLPLLLIWRRHRSPSAFWLATAFVLLAVVLLAGLAVSEDDNQLGSVELWFTKFVVIGIIAYPYCFLRFVLSFGDRRKTRRACGFSTMFLIAVTVVLPDWPTADNRPDWLAAYSVAVLAQWLVPLSIGAIRLWNLGSAGASITRRRMHLRLIRELRGSSDRDRVLRSGSRSTS